MLSSEKKVNVFLLTAFIAVLFFGLGFFTKGIQGNHFVLPSQSKLNFSILDKIWQETKENYVEPTKIDPEKAIYGAASGMVKSLQDPYTSFLDPQETKDLNKYLASKFEGIGVEVE